MPILSILIVLIVVGVVLWLMNTYIPMAPPIKTIINVVVILLIVVWVLTLLVPGIGNVRVGK